MVSGPFEPDLDYTSVGKWECMNEKAWLEQIMLLYRIFCVTLPGMQPLFYEKWFFCCLETYAVNGYGFPLGLDHAGRIY